MTDVSRLAKRIAHGVGWRTRRLWRNLPFSENRRRQPRRTREAKGAGKKPSIYSRTSRENLYDGIEFLRNRAVVDAHQKVVMQLRTRLDSDSTAQISVAFVVSSAARWNAGRLFDLMNEHPRFSPKVVLFPPHFPGVEQAERTSEFLAQERFFRSIDANLSVHYELDADETLPIEDLDADVVFLEMPWGMKDFPRRLTGRALPVYMHYGFMVMANHEMHYNVASFHSYLWSYYTQTEGHRRLHLEHDPSAEERIVVTGYPKLDVYDPGHLFDDDPWASSGLEAHPRIIYAPHHSLGADNLGMSTFTWSGDAVAHLRAKYPSTTWLYKPHPGLRFAVARNGLMSLDEYDEYARTWEEGPRSFSMTAGDYFAHFRTSDALITCSGSFLAEYLPTGRPIIWLLSDQTVGLNRVGMRFSEGYYMVRTAEELHDVFVDVVINGNDPLASTRAALAQELFPLGYSASSAIISHLEGELLPSW